ncbi:MAG TPA: hypothetical protein VNZ52_11830 [Candidatus Thermoplasmatota archaeon]|nr:hypothetical protein [Candidatus Thermoplasmatota archaeon]
MAAQELGIVGAVAGALALVLAPPFAPEARLLGDQTTSVALLAVITALIAGWGALSVARNRPKPWTADTKVGIAAGALGVLLGGVGAVVLLVRYGFTI